MPSFTERIARSNPLLATGQIFLVRGTDTTGRKAWYYVRVAASRSVAFERLQGSPSLNLGDWGTIARSGYGESPPDEIKAWAEQHLGFREE